MHGHKPSQCYFKASRGINVALSDLVFNGIFFRHAEKMTMLSKITLALAFAFTVIYVVPASAGPRTCGYSAMQYDSSGTWTGPYCD